MGIYAEYLEKQMNFANLTLERKKQLARISQIRGRDVLAVVADLNKGGAPISINYTDLVPLQDQLHNLSGKKIDLILETPGGSGEVAEDIVRILRQKYEEVAVVVPGYAKSAGTIIAMSADEILMGEASALGPIDAQLQWQGKVFSADALIEGFEKIKREVTTSNNLNKAYIPILQGISPGELQAAENAKNFAIRLVKDWLVRYKFKSWTHHRTTAPGTPVTSQEKEKRAEEIASALSNHSSWLTHGRSLKIQDLIKLRLEVTDYSKISDLNDAITRYFVLLQMTFDTNIYKIFETKDSQIYRFVAQNVPSPSHLANADIAEFDVSCPKCQNKQVVQAGLGKASPLKPGRVAFPKNNKLKCNKCGVEIDLTAARQQLEAQTKKALV